MNNLKANLDPPEPLYLQQTAKFLIFMILRAYANYCETVRPKRRRFNLSAVPCGGEPAGSYSVSFG